MKTRKAADSRNLAPGEREEREERAGRDLFEMAERYRLANKATNDVIWDWDIANDAQRWNEAGSAVFGWTDIVEAPQTSAWWMDRVHPEDWSRVDQTFQAAVSDPAVDRWNADYRFRKADGAYAFVVDRGYILRDADGRAVRMIGSMLDLTGRKQAEEALRETSMRLHESVRAANVGLWDWDLATHRVRYSPEWKGQIGYEDAEIGDGLEEWRSRVHPEDLAPTLKKIGDAITGERQRYQTEFRFRHKDGSYRWIVAQCSLLRDGEGKVVRVIGSHLDLTEHKKAEAEREEALLRAEAASHAKSEFLAVMSHELRSPLNGVMGFAELLSDTGLDDEQRGYVQTISSSGEHLLSLVNDILEYTSMEHGAMKILEAPLALAGLVDISRQTVSTIAAEKGIGLYSEVAPGVPEQILGDERRIRQILINLLSNAVKFTSKGSVVLRIAPAVDGTGRFLDFSIEDSGIGISPEMLARLFQPFTQADSRLNRAYGGTGLGLSISKHLAEAMDGSISVTSTPGMGSTFTFRFPLKLFPGTAPRLCLEQPGTGALPGAPVLVVDDLEESRKLVGKAPQ